MKTEKNLVVSSPEQFILLHIRTAHSEGRYGGRVQTNEPGKTFPITFPSKNPWWGFQWIATTKKHHVGGKLKTSSTKRKCGPSDQSADAGIAGGGGRDASKRSIHALERGIFLKGKSCFSYFSVLKLREVNFCHWEFSRWTHVFVLTRKQFFFFVCF